MGQDRHLELGDNKPLLWGIGMVAIGGLISLASFTASDSGDSHVVIAALLVAGGINLARGLHLHRRHGRRANSPKEFIEDRVDIG